MIPKIFNVGNFDQSLCSGDDGLEVWFNNLPSGAQETIANKYNEGEPFIDAETKHDWKGIDFSYNLTSTTQFSIFYGSQKGGLICANGTCTEQPGFEDGYKITFRSLF